jgi:kynurenine formamidase
MHAGIGTHMDAPSHCIPGGIGIDQIPLEQLLVPCVVIDVSAQAFDQYQVSVDEILAFEQRHGKIPEHALVIFYTGWEKFWHDPEKYRNDYHFPCLSKEVAQWLLDRNVAGMGIDTLSPDRPETGFWVHQLLLGAGKYIIENVANAKSVPATGAYSLALPIKAKDATEAPMRLVAIIFSSPVV